MPLLESMLLSLLLTPVEIGPSNASPGLRSFFLCYHGEALEGPISTGVSNKLNNIDSNNGILISKNTILYIYMYF